MKPLGVDIIWNPIADHRFDDSSVIVKNRTRKLTLVLSQLKNYIPLWS